VPTNRIVAASTAVVIGQRGSAAVLVDSLMGWRPL
jgi:hypothetical protein